MKTCSDYHETADRLEKAAASLAGAAVRESGQRGEFAGVLRREDIQHARNLFEVAGMVRELAKRMEPA